jgi:hypothetical protein
MRTKYGTILMVLSFILILSTSAFAQTIQYAHVNVYNILHGEGPTGELPIEYGFQIFIYTVQNLGEVSTEDIILTVDGIPLLITVVDIAEWDPEASMFYIVARGLFGDVFTEPILGEYQVTVRGSSPFYIGELGDIPVDAPEFFYPRHGQMIADTTPTFNWEAFLSNYLGVLFSPWAHEINLTFPDGTRLTAFPIDGTQTSLDYSTYEDWYVEYGDMDPPEELPVGGYSLSIHSNHVVVDTPQDGGFSFEHHRIIEFWVVENLMVEIDIKPGSYPNAINLKKKGLIPVAILTTPDFDATTVDPLSVQFGPDGAVEAHGKGHIEDVDGDGDDDLVLHFKTQETGIEPGDTEASLIGMTFGGTVIYGSDSIVTVPKGK